MPSENHFEKRTVVRTVQHLSKITWGKRGDSEKTEITDEKLSIVLKRSKEARWVNPPFERLE